MKQSPTNEPRTPRYTGLTPEFILRHDCDPPHCSNLPRARRMQGIDSIGRAHDYAPEQGYSLDGARAVLFGNWNHFSHRAGDLLERAGYILEWEDEWRACDGCGRAIRTSPNSFSWQPAFIDTDDGTYCVECADWPEYLRGLEDQPRKACFSHVDPSEYGYVRLSDPGEFESGFHPGQTDDPQTILAALHEKRQHGILFRVLSTGQFDVNFETWQRIGSDSDSEECES